MRKKGITNCVVTQISMNSFPILVCFPNKTLNTVVMKTSKQNYAYRHNISTVRKSEICLGDLMFDLMTLTNQYKCVYYITA